MDNQIISNLKVAVSRLEETAEGQLRGGFAIIGGSTDSPDGTDIGCTNVNNRCTNPGCNSGCDDGIVNIACTNINCATVATSGSGAPAMGMTFAL